MEQVETFLALMEARSLEGAARVLGVNHSTVYRRLQKLEARSGGPLFHRQGSTYVPTELAEMLRPVADQVVSDRQAFERALIGTGGGLERIRLSLPYGVLPLVTHAVSRFRNAHPDVEVVVRVGANALDLTRDADVAVRLTSDPDPDLIGRRIGPVGWAAYSRVRGEVKGRAWVGYNAQAQHLEPVRHWRASWPGAQVAYVAPSPDAVVDLLRSDDVVGYCPCYAAELEPVLHRVSEVRQFGAVWMLYDPSLRGCGLVRSFTQELAETLQRRASLFGGTAHSDVRVFPATG